MTPLASWAFLALAIAPIVLCCWLLWPRSPRSGASVASSAARRDGDTPEDHATYVYRPVEAKRTRLTAAQRRARRRSLDRMSRRGVRADKGKGGSHPLSGPPESTNAEHDNRDASGLSGSAAPHTPNATGSH